MRFGATGCMHGLRGNTLIPNHLCDTLQLNTIHCKTPKKKTQNPPRATSWGFDPPPGTIHRHCYVIDPNQLMSSDLHVAD